ncbi:DUF1963 domain-containing protein [Methylotenera sp.]|uniref:DUF1963 domain-containing protein n=1 Tax=Methylotenera sp. TaxID=2051956 RepID=UPI0027326657|nr:DUF1963 domain-containing protein [Methylotenera sp.]MDP3211914.1 DUF1963 domain-containing protein [Methylotenera sp.]
MSVETIPKDYEKLKTLLAEFVANDDEDFFEFVNDNIVNSIDAYAWAWDPILKKVSTGDIDRCGDVLYGPIYTCSGYEWPEYGGFPMVPIIQLDLDRCRDVSGMEFGSGLLQVWNGHKQDVQDSMVRIIPNSSVSKDNLLPIPKIDRMLTFNIPPDWTIDLIEDEDISETAVQIIGYKAKRFTSQLTFGAKGVFGKPSNWASSGVPLEKIKSFDEILKSNSKKWSPANNHLFGTFEPIQYSGSERDTPLFCFEGDYGFDWGDGGNAQLFFRKDESGNVSFYMDWSCY